MASAQLMICQICNIILACLPGTTVTYRCWDAVFAEYERFDFTGKTLAFIGLGDQDGYPDNFLDALGTLAKPAMKNGAKSLVTAHDGLTF